MRVLVLVLALVFVAPTSAQTGRYSYRPERVPVGTVYHYTKSNVDGSNPWKLSAYVASRTRFDVVKRGDGAGNVVNVVADFDPSRGVAEHVEQWNVRDGRMQMSMYGDLALDGASLRFATAAGQSLTIDAAAQPVHVYGFDLQSLNYAYRHLDAPDKPFEIGLIGVNPKPTPERPAPIVFLGRTKFEYLGEESIHGTIARKYKITGGEIPGLIWFNRDAGHIEKIESSVPNSTDWTSYKLELTGVEQMTPIAWQQFKSDVLAKYTSAR